jgi:hypothetical protein
MGVEVETEGVGEASYEKGQYENVSIVDTTTVEGVYFEGVAGGSVTVVTPLELGVLLGFGINWNVAAKHIDLHGGFSHWRTAFRDGWNQQTTNFTATSVASHCQTVNGFTRWTNNGNFALVVPAAASSISLIAEAADGDITLQAGDGDVGSLSLASNKVKLSSAGEVSVTGTTKASMSSGAGGLNLSDTQVSLKCNTAGLTATAEATTLSGAKVEIGVPGTPNTSQVATAATVAATAAPLDVTTAAINNLQGRLRDLQDKIGKSKMLSYLLK